MNLALQIWLQLQSFSKVLGQMPQTHISYPNVISLAPYSMFDRIKHFVLAKNNA